MKLAGALLVVILVVLTGCAGQAPEAPPEPKAASPSQSEPAAPEYPDTSAQVVLSYWDAMNSYDLELALSYYEEQYAEQEREWVADDIGNLNRYSVTLSVLEVSEPLYMSPDIQDKVRHDIVLKTPIDERELSYLLVKVDGDWKIYFEGMTHSFPDVREFIIDLLTKYGELQRVEVMINAEQEIGESRSVTDYVLTELIESGEIIESSSGVYSLP